MTDTIEDETLKMVEDIIESLITTKKTLSDIVKLKDGSVLNIPPNYPAHDMKDKILPVIENIPQGEEATRIFIKNKETGIVLGSPVGAYGTIYITRFGTPHTFDYNLHRYDDFRSILFNDNCGVCPFHKFGCDSKITSLMLPDYDTRINTCSKHRYMPFYLGNLNIAETTNLRLFLEDKILLKLATYCPYDSSKKIALLQKIKVILNLAEKNRINKIHLDDELKLRGIHYYNHGFKHHNKYGWALLYDNNYNRTAHIFLDELTDDEKVKNALSLFAFEIITAKQEHDIPYAINYIKKQNKSNFTYLSKIDKTYFNLSSKEILSNKLLF